MLLACFCFSSIPLDRHSSILIHQVSESAALSHERDSCLVLPHTSFITSAYFPSSSSSSSFCPLLYLLLAASSPSFSTSLLGWPRHEKERERCKHNNTYSVIEAARSLTLHSLLYQTRNITTPLIASQSQATVAGAWQIAQSGSILTIDFCDCWKVSTEYIV